MKRYLIMLTLILTILLPFVAEAGIYGVLKGKVTNADTGEGLVGATVRVVGTTKGTKVTNRNGSYTIVGLSTGVWKIRFTFTGKKEVIKSVSISADKTSTVNAKLGDGMSVAPTVDIVAKKLVRTDEIGTMKNLTNDQLTNVAGSNIAGIVALSAGVQTSGTGFAVRNTRSSETQIRVDGMNVTNAFSGGLGAGGVAYTPQVSPYAISEVQVMRGSFSAEYGDALGGVVNSMVNTGRLDRYEGYIAYRTDLDFLYGSLPFDVNVEKQGNKYVPVTGGEGADIAGPGTNDVSFGTGGRIPFTKKSTFYITGSYRDEQNPGGGKELFDPWGNNIAKLPDEGAWVKSLTPRLKFGLTDNISLTLGGTWGMTNYQTSSWGWLYANDEGLMFDDNHEVMTDAAGNNLTNGVPERIAKQQIWNILNTNYFVKINHTINPKTFYEIRLSQSANNDERSRREPGEWGDPDFFSGYKLLFPHDEWKINTAGNGLEPGSDLAADEYMSLQKERTTEDGYIKGYYPTENPLTGYYEGSYNSTGSYNPWGQRYFTATHGNSGGFSFRNAYISEIDANLTQSIDHGEFNHYLKTGVNVQLFELHRHYNATPDDGGIAFRDIYTDKWGGNLYTDKEEVLAKTEKPFEPLQIGAYVNDQVTYRGIIISAGVRLDYFMPNADYRKYDDDNPKFISIVDADSMFAAASNKYQLSPRLQVSYPITETSVLAISYGMLFQNPIKNALYNGFSVENIRSGSLLGNPNLEAQKVKNYEVRLDQQIASNMKISANVYYKDIYNNLGVSHIPDSRSPFFEYRVNEYGNNRGVELEFYKQPTREDHLYIDANYTLSWVRGTSDGSTSNANSPVDPYTGFQAFPLATYPLGRDIRHRVKGTLGLAWADEDGPEVYGYHYLQNTNFTFTGSWRSGAPYTKSDKVGNPLGERNAERFPDYWYLNMRFQKTINMKALLGDNFNQKIVLFIDVNNLLNRRVVTRFFTSTGDPIDNGVSLENSIGNFTNVTYFKEANLANAESFKNDQYDYYGKRLYNEAADYNNDGMVSREETYQGYLNYIEMSMKFLGNYQYPRTVWGGFQIKF